MKYKNLLKGKEIVHCYQLNEIQVWLKSFKEKNFDAKSEQILFDLVCGDFNIDNMSPGLFSNL